MTSDRTGSLTCSRGIHCRAPISAYQVLFPHVRQVHDVDPVRDPARAPQVLPLDARRGTALLSCPVSSSVPAVIPPARRFRRAAPSSPAAANRRTTLIAAISSQDAWFSSRCVLSGVRSRACRAMLHPFTRGSPLASARRVLARLQPRLRAGKARPQPLQQLSPFPQRQPRAYPDGSSRLRFCCLHKHMNRQAAAPYARHPESAFPQFRTPSAAAVLGV